MSNLLAIILSLAMLLTGVPDTGALEAPVGRMLTLGNLEVRHNDEVVTLLPAAVLGVTVDSERAIYDFYIEAEGERYLTFQAAASDEGLVVANENSNTRFLLTPEELESWSDAARLSTTAGLDDDQAAQISAVIKIYCEELMPALVRLMGTLNDPEAMDALRQRGWEIYDEMIGRGEGVPGKVEYEGELYDALTYNYELDGQQIGALTDAMCAADESLSAYVAAMFKMYAYMPEESGLAGVDSYESLLGRFDVSMRIGESIADNGLNMMDAKLTMSMPGMEAPVVYNTHSARLGDTEFSTILWEQEVDGANLEFYGESSRDGRDFNISFNVTGNPVGETGGGEVEGDQPDMLYVTLDFDRSFDETTGVIEDSASFNMDAATTDLHVFATLDSQSDGDGFGTCAFNGDYTVGDDNWNASFEAAVTDETVALVADAEGASDFSALSVATLMGSVVTGDIKKLTEREDVSQLLALFAPAPEAPEEEPEEPETEDDRDLAFAHPSFEWLPEGYSVEDVDVDPQYDNVTCTLVNDETDGTITVDITTSYDADDVHYFVVRDDSFNDLDGVLVTEDDYGDFYLYTVDNGSAYITIYPDSKDVPATDILNIILGLKF